jgi:hypothetical protein
MEAERYNTKNTPTEKELAMGKAIANSLLFAHLSMLLTGRPERCELLMVDQRGR